MISKNIENRLYHTISYIFSSIFLAFSFKATQIILYDMQRPIKSKTFIYLFALLYLKIK